MVERCVVCGQTLPDGIPVAEMHRRVHKLAAAAAEREATKVRRELDRQYRLQLKAQADAIRKRVTLEAQASSDREVALLKQKLDAVQHASGRAVEKAVKKAEASSRQEVAVLRRKVETAAVAIERAAEKAAKQAATEATRASRREVELVKARAAKERAQHAADTARLKTRVDDLSLKLERQTSEQMGDMTEVDALAALKKAFPHDDIQRIGHGIRGADILQKVMDSGAEVGRIVYECKNASSWQNEWLTKARSYRSEYQTPWVVIASRCFPRKEKWFVVERGLPIIELRLIVRLAEVIRAAVLEIGALRLTTGGRQVKAEQMFEYVLGDHFASRIRSIAEAVTALRTQQEKERGWHSETWAKQTRLYDEVDGGRREIAAEVRAIAEAPVRAALRVIGGSAKR